jgi:hypothetical protein
MVIVSKHQLYNITWKTARFEIYSLVLDGFCTLNLINCELSSLMENKILGASVTADAKLSSLASQCV